MSIEIKISDLTAKTGALEGSDILLISDYNGSTYDTKKITGSQIVPYKSFIGLLNQTGTSAPTITGGYSQLTGTLTFARTSVGVYTITNSVAEFLSNKTFVFRQSGNSSANYNMLFDLSSTTVITLFFYNNTTLSDDIPANDSLEIKIIN